MFEIKVTSKNGKFEDSVRCGANACELGRSRDSILRVRGWKVAPRHVRFEKELGGIFVEDLSRGFGMSVNGKKCSRHGPLQPQDIIEFGGYKVMVALVERLANGETAIVAADASVVESPKAESSGLEGASAVEGAAALEGSAKDKSIAADSSRDALSTETQQQEAGGEESQIQGQSPTSVKSADDADRTVYMEWAQYVHKALLKQLDLKRMHLDEMSPDQVRSQLADIIDTIIQGLSTTIPSSVDSLRLKRIVLDETVGLGALEELLADPSITEVMVNNFDDIYIERAGRLQQSTVTFSSPDAVMSTIERIVSPLGRRIDESSPMVDARLKDGSRVNAIIPPLALRGPCITIRKFSDKKLTDRDLIAFGTVDESMVSFMRMCVEQRCNIIVSGGTGSGKTTLLNILSDFIPMSERVVTVEDAAELKLAQPHVIPLEARPANMEGKGQITIRDLVKNCLRMRPDRIVVGECRGGEALDMLQAMNTGHDGSLTTAHANNPRDMLRRLEVMVLMSGMDLPITAIREQVASAVDIVIQQSRFGDGSRRITSVTEITGIEGSTIQLNEIFRYQQKGFDSDGRVKGEFVATGMVPKFYEELVERGIEVDMSIFKP